MKTLEGIDQTDIDILSILSMDGKYSYAEIGQKLFVSAGTVHVRIKKMTELGVITGSNLKIDYHKLGYDVVAFLGIYLEKSKLYNDVALAIKEIPEVIEAHYTTGVYSIFVKVICRDTIHLRTVLSEKIQKIDGIARTETFISLDETIHRPPKLNGNPTED